MECFALFLRALLCIRHGVFCDAAARRVGSHSSVTSLLFSAAIKSEKSPLSSGGIMSFRTRTVRLVIRFEDIDQGHNEAFRSTRYMPRSVGAGFVNMR